MRGTRLSSEAAAIVATFKRTPAQKEVEILWAALIKCYGSPALALRAAQSNPQARGSY